MHQNAVEMLPPKKLLLKVQSCIDIWQRVIGRLHDLKRLQRCHTWLERCCAHAANSKQLTCLLTLLPQFLIAVQLCRLRCQVGYCHSIPKASPLRTRPLWLCLLLFNFSTLHRPKVNSQQTHCTTLTKPYMAHSPSPD